MLKTSIATLGLALSLGSFSAPALADSYYGVGISAGEQRSSESLMVNMELVEELSLRGRFTDFENPEASLVLTYNDILEGVYFGGGVVAKVGLENGNLTQVSNTNAILELGYDKEIPGFGGFNVGAQKTLTDEDSYSFFVGLGQKF